MQRDLGKHTVRSFDQRLNGILDLVLQMSRLALESISIVEEAINGNKRLVGLIRNHDGEINKYDQNISDEVVAFIALRQPKAHDLRVAVSIIKVSSNLERVLGYRKP